MEDQACLPVELATYWNRQPHHTSTVHYHCTAALYWDTRYSRQLVESRPSYSDHTCMHVHTLQVDFTELNEWIKLI